MKRLLTVLFLMAFGFSLTAQNSAPINKDIVKHNFVSSSDKAALMQDFESDLFLPPFWSESENEVNFNQGTEADWFAIDGNCAYLIINNLSVGEDLITPLLDVDGSVSDITFDCWDGNGSFGAGNGFLQLKYSTDMLSWTDVGSEIELTTDAPATYTVSISAVPNGQYYFAFSFTSTFDFSPYNSVIALDNIVGPDIVLDSNDDMGISSLSPTTIVPGSTITPEVNVINLGENTADDFMVGVVVNDGMSDVYSSTISITSAGLDPFDEMVVSMPDDFTPAFSGQYTITAVVTYVGDENNSNNSMSEFGLIGYFQADATYTTCAGAFYDAGGLDDYPDNQLTTLTVYPELGSFLSVTFSEVNIEQDWDTLFIYNGVDANAPLLAELTGSYTDISYQGMNEDGALTFVFFSDGAVHESGWVAEFSCTEGNFVTFNVDMNTPITLGEFVPGTDVVYIAGDPWGWAEPGTNADLLFSDDDSNGEYSKSFILPTGDIQYKYFDGPGWAYGEWDGGDNRTYTVTANVTINDVWALEYLVTFNVTDGTNPVEGAMIDVNDATYTGTTDASGMFYMAAEDGMYDLIVMADTYSTYTATFEVSGENAMVDVILLPSAVEEITTMIKVFPNPSNGLFTVNTEENINLEVFDITGRIVNAQSVIGSTQVEIDKAGVYFFKFSNENGSVIKKVIVQ
jgi:hypothetical protein